MSSVQKPNLLYFYKVEMYIAAQTSQANQCVLVYAPEKICSGASL